MDGHRTAERRSLALHRAIAARLDASIISRARERLARLSKNHYRECWELILTQPIEAVAAAIVRDDEEMRTLRQATPFTFVIDARERWQIWRSVR
jgi:hypothetical protein